MDLIKNIEESFIKKELPSFKSGDTVKVNVKVSEGNRDRIQTFEGVVIAVNDVGVNASFKTSTLSFISKVGSIEEDGIK
jgi:large subunit ribosomal protein L19